MSNNVSSLIGGASSIRGYGGLASGLDRDSLIENMTAATRAKIAKQGQKKQTYSWQQEAYRSVSDKLVAFSKKYMSYTSQETNLSSPSFWSRSNITAKGEYSKYVSVTGSSSNVDGMSIVGVKQLAKKASMTSDGTVSDRLLSTDAINFGTEAVSNLEGEALYFKVGNKTYGVSLPSGTTDDGFTYDYSTAEKAKESITKALSNVKIGDGKTLADEIGVETEGTGADNTLSKLNFISKDEAGNTVQLLTGTKNALKALGITDIDSLSEQDRTIGKTGFSDKIKDLEQEFFDEKTFAQRLAGKSVSFTYNGTTKSISFGTEAEINTNITNSDQLATYMKSELNKAFGTGRIDVTSVDGKLNFQTTIPGTGAVDTSSILSISSADKGVIGSTGVLNVEYGESNRLNLSSPLLKSGLKGIPTGVTADQELKISINGKPIEGLTYGSSISDIMNKINSSEAGVTVSYLHNADKFTIVSKEEGAAGKIELGTTDDTNLLFGNSTYTEGKDAIISVKYSDSEEPVTLVRGNNSFNLDGLNITVNDTFNYQDGKLVENGAPVTFDAKSDSESIVSAVSDMVDDFNEMLELVNKEASTKPNRKYAPLTDEQKADMKEDQIEKWEKKAKEGMLFNDSDLRGLADSLRFIFDSGSSEKAKLESFGISTSSNYSDNGKLVFDKTKFKAALESKPEEVKDLFTKVADPNSNEQGGFMGRLSTITQKYASTTGAVKGILIEKAGSVSAPTSILSNSLQKSMDSIDKYVKELQSRLDTETDRYIKQFTTLETVISQMNSQSSWLSSQVSS
ncbi:flagellar filament capping protein FliD [Clostridium sp. E02]|uniref:flagellar filament capping protein FliD n=1 Tax=Clostridium sp. E02 TaxID=2487134 RepID=UPI000F527CE7|nr:flagellar filament capping protein FliD [Clostridium sp. E02]